MDGLLIAKILVSIGAVLGLSLLTERLSPRLAGLLSGYPIGTAIALYFIGYENGLDFAIQGAPYALAGLAATLSFAAAYSMAARITGGVTGLVLSCLLSLTAFFGVSYGLSQIPLTPISAILPTLATILVFSIAFHWVPEIKVSQPIRLGPTVLATRAGLAAAVVLLITGTAHLVGPNWAGLFSAFPSTVFPLYLIIHWNYGPAPIHTMVRNYPRGMGALLIYCLLLPWAYGSFGLNIGTLVCFAGASLYLLIYGLMAYRLRRWQATKATGGKVNARGSLPLSVMRKDCCREIHIGTGA